MKHRRVRATMFYVLFLGKPQVYPESRSGAELRSWIVRHRSKELVNCVEELGRRVNRW